ncbi:MAG TPA: hypothetical protein VF980_10635 [Thermoanaerobaculia bacterium]
MTLRVAFLSRAAQQGSIYLDVCEELEAMRVETQTIVVDDAMFRMSDLEIDADLYVLRTRSIAGFSAAAALSLAGARFLVPIERERVIRNRFLVQQTLIASNIPAPRAYIAANAAALAAILRDRGPLVIKPFEVSAPKSAIVVRHENDLPRDMRGPLFAQELVPHTTADIKLYGIGSGVYAIRRNFPARTREEKLGEAIIPCPDMIEIAVRCRKAFGLDLFGVDLIESPDGLMVVDVNSTPGYKGVHDAAHLIAELLYDEVFVEPAMEAV